LDKMAKLFERILFDSDFVGEGDFSRDDYTNLMEYLTREKLELLIPYTGDDLGMRINKNGICVLEENNYHLKNGVVVRYLSQNPGYVLDNGVSYEKGKTFCCVIGHSPKIIDKVAELILETQKNQNHETDR